MDKPRNPFLDDFPFIPLSQRFVLHKKINTVLETGEERYTLEYYFLYMDDNKELCSVSFFPLDEPLARETPNIPDEMSVLEVGIYPVFEKDYEQFRKDNQDKIEGKSLIVTDEDGGEVGLVVFRIEGDEEYNPIHPGRWCLWYNNEEFARAKSELSNARKRHKEFRSSDVLEKTVEFYEKVVGEYINWYRSNGFEEPKKTLPIEVPTLSKWRDLTITFTSNESVQMRISGQRPITLTYINLGFVDRRKGDRPNILWGLLKGIAAYQGSLPLDSPLLNIDTGTRKKTEKQIGRIRKTLKTYFGLDKNPIQWKRYEGYECVFMLEMLNHLRNQLQEDYSQDSL